MVVRVGREDVEVALTLGILSLLDFTSTYEALSLGLKELNPVISRYGLWVYPILFLAALASCFILDRLATRLKALVRPSRIIILFYIITVANNISLLHVYRT